MHGKQNVKKITKLVTLDNTEHICQKKFEAKF